MTVALLIKAEASGFQRSVKWAERIARARDQAQVLAIRQLGTGKPTLTREPTEAANAAEGSAAEGIPAQDIPAQDTGDLRLPDAASLWRITGDIQRNALLPMLDDEDVDLLILARDDAPRSNRPEDALDVDLLEHAACATMIVRTAVGNETGEPRERPNNPRIFVPVNLDPASRYALGFARSESATITALLVHKAEKDDADRPNAVGPKSGGPDPVGRADADPLAIGHRQLDQILDALSAEDRERIRPKVVIGESARATIDPSGPSSSPGESSSPIRATPPQATRHDPLPPCGRRIRRRRRPRGRSAVRPADGEAARPGGTRRGTGLASRDRHQAPAGARPRAPETRRPRLPPGGHDAGRRQRRLLPVRWRRVRLPTPMGRAGRDDPRGPRHVGGRAPAPLHRHAPLEAMRRHAGPFFAYGWAFGALLASVIWHLRHYALVSSVLVDIGDLARLTLSPMAMAVLVVSGMTR